MNTWRAVVTGCLVAATGFVLLVVVPNQLLQVSGLSRGRAVMFATMEFAGALVGLLWTLRRLQQRKLL